MDGRDAASTIRAAAPRRSRGATPRDLLIARIRLITRAIDRVGLRVVFNTMERSAHPSSLRAMRILDRRIVRTLLITLVTAVVGRLAVTTTMDRVARPKNLLAITRKLEI